ncbi:MAG TPA: MerR family DNA-binding transcriptional regulator, partial [Dietzia timorensis]
MQYDGGEHRWSVGEVAKLAGITVRTLHHWDSLGLVSP